MSQVHIEPRTDSFIKQFTDLKEKGIIASNKELAKVLGIASVTTISEILARRQNIKPTLYQRFLHLYNAQINSENSVSRGTVKEPAPAYTTQDAMVTPGSRVSLEKSIENLTEDRLKSTAIIEKLREDNAKSIAVIERLVTLMERNYGNPGPGLDNPGTPGTETKLPDRKKPAQQ